MDTDLKKSEECEKRPQFGNRYLTEEKDVYTHNAWDDVEWDEEQEKVNKPVLMLYFPLSFAYRERPPDNFLGSTQHFYFQAAQDIVVNNCAKKLAAEDAEKLQTNASENWNKFYNIHNNRFFKDRNWLFTEFPELFPSHHSMKKIQDNNTLQDKEKMTEDHALTILEVSNFIIDLSRNIISDIH